MATKTRRPRPGTTGNGQARHVNRIARHAGAPTEPADHSGVENLDKVRDILFGSQIRDNERRFVRLEERVAKETVDVREESRKRLDTVESYLKKEVQSLLERLKSEQTQRADALKDVAADLKQTAKDLQQRTTELQDQLSEAQRELRQEMLEQSKTLGQELQQSRLEAAGELERAAGELRSQKLDRATMAELLMELAAKISQESE